MSAVSATQRNFHPGALFLLDPASLGLRTTNGPRNAISCPGTRHRACEAINDLQHWQILIGITGKKQIEVRLNT